MATVTSISMPMQAGYVPLNNQAAQQAQLQYQNRNIPTIKGLAITQIVIGILCILLEIANTIAEPDPWVLNARAGFWAGACILFTGAIGLQSAVTSYQLPGGGTKSNGVYIAFSIISTVASFVAGILFIFAIAYFDGGCYVGYVLNDIFPGCRHRNAGLGLYGTLLLLMVIEFFISIVAAVYACQRGCSSPTQGYVVQPAQQTVTVISTGQGGTSQYQQVAPTPYGISVAQPYNQYPPAPNSVSVAQPYNQYPPAPNSSAPPQNHGQPMFVQAQQYPIQAQTNVVYSEKPPNNTGFDTAPPQYEK